MKLQYFLFLFILGLGACDDDYFHDSDIANQERLTNGLQSQL